MNKATLAIQSFGRENEYRRAVLTVMSFFAHIPKAADGISVLLFTDKPEWFHPYFNDLPISYILLSPEKIKEMRGEIDFLHRMKIALIEEALDVCEGNLLYADSDTFFTADPLPLLAQVSPERSFMHLLEYHFTEGVEDTTATYLKFLALTRNNTFHLADGTSFKVRPDHASWNAGVMFFHPSHKRFIPDVYTLTDQFFPSSGSHAAEQYAFSLVLQENTQLRACDDVIYHYWFRPKKLIADEFLLSELNNRFRSKPLSEKLEIVKAWTAMLPEYFEHHALMIRDEAIQAFNTNKFRLGYRLTGKLMVKAPWNNLNFLKDVLYHFKRQITGQ